jgi:hypothetical protein
MADITDESVFDPVPLIEVGQKVKGGADGPANTPLVVLANRTKYLKDQLESLISAGINVIGSLSSVDDLHAIDTTNMAVGSAYFAEGQLWAWNLIEWVGSGSLLGPRGINVLGSWDDATPLPDPTANKAGDAYTWNGDVWLLVPQPGGWVNIGLRGVAGKSAYESAVDNGETGSEIEWLGNLVGKSAYQSWLDLGHIGSEADFLTGLRGASAYDTWIGEGNVGNPGAFLAALKGESGTVKVLGSFDNLAELYALPTQGLADGSGYFAEGQLWVWNLIEWIGSGSLLGPRGITLLGTWPNGPALPDVSSSAVGDAYMWRSDIWLLVPGYDGTAPPVGEDPPLPIWVSIGLEGPVGQSAYEAAVEVGFAGTKPQWLASLIGKSAYQTWLDLGNVGDRQAFLNTLVSTEPGPRGLEGPAKAPFEVMGSKASVGQLPTPGTADEAWYVGSHLYVWVTTQTQYVDLGSVGGLSAYELAVSDGFGGNLQQWLDSLKSTVAGPIGPRGQNLNVKGTVPNQSALGNIQGVVEQDAYALADTGDLWVFVDAAWKNLGPFRGKSIYQVWLDNGHSGDEATYLASLQGRNGTNGVNIIVKGSVATFTALTATPAEQDVYSVRDENTLYAYVGGGWIPLGTFKGADGAPGTDGANGSSITIVKVLTPGDQAVPDPVANAGKAYVDLNGHIQLSIGGVWLDSGPVGATGDRGPQGHGVNLRGTVTGPTYLPRVDQGAVDGDGYFIESSKLLYVMTDGQWEGPFDIIGPEGPPGADGEKGEAGTSINILGAYPTLADLATAHPTGNLGDGYLVGNNLAIWTTANGGEWIDIGLVRGPQGIQGVQGPIGIGKKGDKGDKGSSWITLPAGVDEPGLGFTGNIGDWAVSDTFKVYYKSAVTGWTYWGRLVAGDVNSPLLSVGKVVRLGNEWVPLLVDEAPAMINGKVYVRSLKAGSTTNEGEWTELVFPPQISEPAADGQPYMRMRANGQPVGSWALYTAPTLASLGGVPTSALGTTVAQLVAGVVPASQLPSYVDDVLEFANQAAFPATGESGKIYISLATNAQFRWSGSVYIGLVASPGTTDAVVEGATNLYFTQARVRSTPLTGFSLATNSAVVATDTVITAFGKVQAQINAFVPGFADTPVDTNLYARKGDHTWSIITPGFADTPSDTNLYLRKGDHTWSLYTGVTAPANDGHQWIYKASAWASFDRYDLPVQAISATATVDPATNLFAKVDNSAATAKTITLGDGPKAGGAIGARALTVVMKINGAAGVITFAATGATVLVWNGGSPPTLTGSRTILTFLWDGVEWTGASGAVVP